MAAKTETKPAMQNLSDPASFICRALKRLAPPTKAFDPDRSWSYVYHDISTFNLHSIQGELTARRTHDGFIEIDHHRDCPDGFRYFTHAVLRVDDDDLRTPTEWHIETKVAKAADGPAYLNSGLKKRAQIEQGKYILDIAGKQHTQPLTKPYTCKWCLLDAVGQMQRGGTKKIAFTLLDEYDQLCPNQTIAHHGKHKVQSRTGEIVLDCYQHTGTATMPGVFYVDQTGRMLAYLSGMQLLILKSADGEETGYLK